MILKALLTGNCKRSITYHSLFHHAINQEHPVPFLRVWPLIIGILLVFLSYINIVSSVELFHQPTLMHNFLYSLTICLLRYYPRHVLSINMPIFRGKNCFHTASDIFALELSERSYINIRSTVLLWQYWSKRALVESGLSPLSTGVLCRRLWRAKIPDAEWIQFFPLKMGMLMLETCRG